jgi:hypothetical protein
MKLRPSEEHWDRLDAMFNCEENRVIDLNKIIMVFSFFILIVLANIFFNF